MAFARVGFHPGSSHLCHSQDSGVQLWATGHSALKEYYEGMMNLYPGGKESQATPNLFQLYDRDREEDRKSLSPEAAATFRTALGKLGWVAQSRPVVFDACPRSISAASCTRDCDACEYPLHPISSRSKVEVQEL